MFIDKYIQQNKTSKGDTNLKSVVKSISWRILGTIDTMIIAFFITGKIDLALSIGSIEVITKMVLYYFHERMWNKINWSIERKNSNY